MSHAHHQPPCSRAPMARANTTAAPSTRGAIIAPHAARFVCHGFCSPYVGELP
jgi:hypothetical protein